MAASPAPCARPTRQQTRPETLRSPSTLSCHAGDTGPRRVTTSPYASRREEPAGLDRDPVAGGAVAVCGLRIIVGDEYVVPESGASGEAEAGDAAVSWTL